MSEILYSKARGASQQEFEIAADESDTRTIFLKIYNNGRETTVEMDREKTAQKIRNDLKEEKNELKKILNEELGLFEKDEDVKEMPEKEDEAEEIFKFEFSDEPDSTAVPEIEEKKGALEEETIEKRHHSE